MTSLKTKKLVCHPVEPPGSDSCSSLLSSSSSSAGSLSSSKLRVHSKPSVTAGTEVPLAHPGLCSTSWQ